MKILPSEITPYSTYLNRRKFIKNSAAAAITLGIANKLQANHKNNGSKYKQFLDVEDKLNSFEEITTYNNFYEFGMGKTDPHENLSVPISFIVGDVVSITKVSKVKLPAFPAASVTVIVLFLYVPSGNALNVTV